MGNREALLLGAKRCLLEKGYARTTARDIASAAGVSLAAIGYHFSSKEALLTEALLLACGDWDKDFRRILNESVPIDASPRERFESTWARLIQTFETHRSLWVANMELFSQIPRMPEIRGALGNNLQVARSELASMFLNKERSAISERTVQTIGKFHHVLLSGLIMQWLIDPEHALSARDLTEAVLSIAEGMQKTRNAPKSKKGGKSRKRS
jgi:AcrR family transcriptional regulator